MLTDQQKLALQEARNRYLKKKYDAAPSVACKCGCGETIKSLDKYGRQKDYVQGHGHRKYADPKQYKIEYYKRHADELVFKKRIRRTEKKVELILYKGGKCIACQLAYNGKNGAIFEFHHLKDKKFGICSHLADYSMTNLKKEADKCELLCGNCHAMEHSGEF